MNISNLSEFPTDRDHSGGAPEAGPPTRLNYVPELWDRFPSRLTTVDEAPEPLRGAMRDRLPAPADTRRLAFGSACRISGRRSPVTLLAVTDTGWLLASDAEEDGVSVSQCDFANTLFLELTCVLLQGHLKIAFAADGRAQSVTAEFNTVMVEYYQETAQLLLNGMDGLPAGPLRNGKEADPPPASLPMKFHRALLHFKPEGQRLLAFAHWSTVVRDCFHWLQHKLAPQALLALTDRELVFIFEKNAASWFCAREPAKHGNIITYIPQSRLAKFELSEHGLLATADLELRAPEGDGTLKIHFPRARKEEIAALITRAVGQ